MCGAMRTDVGARQIRHRKEMKLYPSFPEKKNLGETVVDLTNLGARDQVHGVACVADQHKDTGHHMGIVTHCSACTG